MKKTVTINISGNIFHIEEDAFEKLQDYLQLLNRFFATQTGGKEILQDIESRIAELLQEKINEGQEAVTNEWVDEVMQRMGNPEDFMDQEQAENAETEMKVEKTKKRLYRDGENRVLGGVCSGMSAYFNIDPVFLRILFVLLIFLGVGISAIIYLILWIVVPKVRTTAQRLEMRGEDATISNIQKTIQDEVDEINSSNSIQRGKDIVNKAGQATVQVAKGLGRVIAVFFGSLFILTGFVGFVAAMVSLAVGGSVFHSSVSGMSPDIDLSGLIGFVVSPGLVSVSILLLVLLIGIPLLAIFFVGTKLVFRYKTNNKLIGFGAFGIWLVALVAMIAVTAGQVNNFSQKNTVSSMKTLNCPTVKTLHLELGTSPESIETDDNLRFDDFTLIKNNDKNVLAGHPSLRIESTTAPDFSVMISKQARGKNAAEVQNNLNLIQYDFSSQDSTLRLDRFFTIGNQAKWRKQEVQIVVKVPVGKRVYLSKDLDQLHFDFDNVNNIWTKEMTDKTWMMTPEGLSIKE